MPKWHYSKGLHDFGNSRHAFLRPDGGWGWPEAAADIRLEKYTDRIDAERIVATVAVLYREFSAGAETHDTAELSPRWAAIARLGTVDRRPRQASRKIENGAAEAAPPDR